MDAPGSGRAIVKLILDSDYRTIDPSRFGRSRVEENRPCRERGIIRDSLHHGSAFPETAQRLHGQYSRTRYRA